MQNWCSPVMDGTTLSEFSRSSLIDFQTVQNWMETWWMPRGRLGKRSIRTCEPAWPALENDRKWTKGSYEFRLWELRPEKSDVYSQTILHYFVISTFPTFTCAALYSICKQTPHCTWIYSTSFPFLVSFIAINLSLCHFHSDKLWIIYLFSFHFRLHDSCSLSNLRLRII